MKTKYFTFGQSHIHVGGFDKDVVVKITAKNPREKMFKLFGKDWSTEYDELPDMRYFSKGIKEL